MKEVLIGLIAVGAGIFVFWLIGMIWYGKRTDITVLHPIAIGIRIVVLIFIFICFLYPIGLFISQSMK